VLPRGSRAFSNDTADANYWFRTNVNGQAIFTQPAPGTFSRTQTRDTRIYNPGFQNWNLAALKDFRFRERNTVQFRAEFFNWLNHPNWGGVNANPRSAAFGKVNGKNSERNIQLSLRYGF
jgi:hypothetical protein